MNTLKELIETKGKCKIDIESHVDDANGELTIQTKSFKKAQEYIIGLCFRYYSYTIDSDLHNFITICLINDDQKIDITTAVGEMFESYIEELQDSGKISYLTVYHNATDPNDNMNGKLSVKSTVRDTIRDKLNIKIVSDTGPENVTSTYRNIDKCIVYQELIGYSYTSFLTKGFKDYKKLKPLRKMAVITNKF